MGHTQFGARVVHGDCLFFTVSPNEQKSALVMRISRYRRNDPWLSGTNYIDQEIHKMCGRDAPSLDSPTALDTPVCGLVQSDSSEVCIELSIPSTEKIAGHEVRRAAAARDPLAVVDAYMVHI